MNDDLATSGDDVRLGEVVRSIARIERHQEAMSAKMDSLDFVRNDVYLADKRTVDVALKAVETDIVDIHTEIIAARAHNRTWAVSIIAAMVAAFGGSLYAIHPH